MNFTKAAKRHEEQAAAYALVGKAKRARAELLRAEQMRMAKRIKRECRAEIDIDDCTQVYGD